HDALRQQPIRRFWPALVPGFLAPQFDWQGGFLVSALLVYELLHPRGDRRGWRVVALDGPAAALPGASGDGVGNWGGGRRRARLRGLFTTGGASVVVAHPAFGEWLRNQGRFLADLLTWPVLALSAAGVVVAAATARRDPLARLAFGFLTGGLLNVLVFP